MLSIPERPRPVPALLDGNSFHIYFVIHGHRRQTELVYSPYYLLGGHLWRLILSQNLLEKSAVGLFLQCGGPGTTGNGDNKKQSGLWDCAVAYRFRLLHPSKWATLNIDPASNTSGLLPSNIAIPASPRDHVTTYQSCFKYDGTGGGTGKWAAHALLQPGLFCDKHRNFVVMCQFDIHDTYNVIEPISESEPAMKFLEFKQALEERTAVVEKLFECDEVLAECKAPAVTLALENEIKTLMRTLDVLPALSNFL